MKNLKLFEEFTKDDFSFWLDMDKLMICKECGHKSRGKDFTIGGFRKKLKCPKCKSDNIDFVPNYVSKSAPNYAPRPKITPHPLKTGYICKYCGGKN